MESFTLSVYNKEKFIPGTVLSDKCGRKYLVTGRPSETTLTLRNLKGNSEFIYYLSKTRYGVRVFINSPEPAELDKEYEDLLI